MKTYVKIIIGVVIAGVVCFLVKPIKEKIVSLLPKKSA